MNIDVTVAHPDDLAGADEAFIYEDLDRELGTTELIAEVFRDLQAEYAGFVTEVLEVVNEHAKVLVRLTSTDRAQAVA